MKLQSIAKLPVLRRELKPPLLRWRTKESRRAYADYQQDHWHPRKSAVMRNIHVLHRITMLPDQQLNVMFMHYDSGHCIDSLVPDPTAYVEQIFRDPISVNAGDTLTIAWNYADGRQPTQHPFPILMAGVVVGARRYFTGAVDLIWQ